MDGEERSRGSLRSSQEGRTEQAGSCGGGRGNRSVLRRRKEGLARHWHNCSRYVLTGPYEMDGGGGEGRAAEDYGGG